MEAKKGELGKFLEAHPSVLLEPNTLDLQTKQSAVGNISEKIQSAKQWLVSLESRLNENARQQAQLQAVQGNGGKFFGMGIAVATDGTIYAATSVTAAADGTITLDNAKNIHAAGLTPAQLEAAIGPGSSVRILRMVTVFVPLSATTGNSHVYGQVTAHDRIVQSFENDVSGGPSTKRSFPLRPGTYHLTVVVKNMATGTSQPSELDFTVD